MIRILLVEDHKIVREGTRQLLAVSPELQVVGEAADGESGVRLADELLPHVVVMDVRLPGMNGIEATRQIKARHPQVRVLVLSAHEDDRYVFPLLDAGADGYLLKTASGAELIRAVFTVHRGETALDPAVAHKVVNRLTRKQLYRAEGMAEGLTEREVEVVRCVSRGMSNKEAGEALGISLQTVQVHLRNIFGKLGVGDRTEAVAFAIRQGWISLDD